MQVKRVIREESKCRECRMQFSQFILLPVPVEVVEGEDEDQDNRRDEGGGDQNRHHLKIFRL